MKQTHLFSLVITVILSGNQVCISQTGQIDDPYLWLEEVESEKSLDWVRAQNALSEKSITTDPLFEPLRQKYLEVFNDKDKIAYPDLVGDYVYNLWQDEKNERGVWRRMSKVDFIDKKTNWEVLLDIDELSKKENKKWVFDGATWLEPANNICLLALSDGGKD
ncbi:MAG: S9 family peptidase, partial [Cyclobacteriaceae bacterium]|nr:S9 family peptidase [Cyclobacteriaceae bacterium]